MSDLYQAAVDKYKGSPSIIILFVLSFIMLILGCNHFIEDTYSSKIGLENLEKAYNLNVQIFSWSYWTMSLAPQIASMVFSYLYLADTRKKWALWVALGSQGMDFFADSWYRSNGQLFQTWQVAGVSTLITFIYFSIGSEFFISVGGGLVIKMLAPFIQTWKMSAQSIQSASKGNYHPNDNKPKDKINSNHQSNRPVPSFTNLMNNIPKNRPVTYPPVLKKSSEDDE